MSVWQYSAVVDGYLAAHVPEEKAGVTYDAEEIWDWMQSKSDKVIVNGH
jgi:hypothetical protein